MKFALPDPSGSKQAAAGISGGPRRSRGRGSEHNMDRAFAKRITADHNFFCANGEHANPDLRKVEKKLAKARQSSGGRLTVHLIDDKPLEIQV
jgi:hypothetical protein